MPLPNTRLIHRLFEQHHRPVADQQMTAECRIHRPSSTPASWDDETGRNIYPEPAVVYEGPCRVQREADATPVTVADKTTAVGGYRVTIPTDTDVVQVNDVATVTACCGDPALVGKQLKVRDARRGSITWQRDLICDLYPDTTR